MWLRCLKVLKQQEILNATKEGAVVSFSCHKAETKLKPMHFAVKMYERNFASRG